MSRRVAIGGLHTECSSYSPLVQTRADFRREEGAALVARASFDFAANGIEPVPIFHERSIPGGPVAAETFAAQVEEFLARLRAALPLDGVLLLMHGAMFVPGTDDPEGALLGAVREVVGPDCIVAASYDLHGQVTERVVGALDAFAAYRTAPHVDVPETHGRAAALLSRALAGGPRPRVVWERVRLLVPGEMSSTFVEPCASLYAALSEHDARPGVEDANLMIGYVWADSPRATAAAVVTCTDAAAGRASAREIAGAYWRARHELAFDMTALPLAEAIAALDGPAILADSGDNPTAGGVGDRADILAACLHARIDGALFAGIAAPAAVESLRQGARQVAVGGELGGGGPRLTLRAEEVRVTGDCAVVRSSGIAVVVGPRRPFHHIADFAGLGLDLADYPLLVVKSGYLAPDIRSLPRARIMALTDGAVSQDLAALENLHRPRGTFPFD